MNNLSSVNVKCDFYVSKKVKIKSVFGFLISLSLFVGTCYGFKYFVIPYCGAELLINFINLFDGNKTDDFFREFLVPNINRIKIVLPQLNFSFDFAAKLMKISVLSIMISFGSIAISYFSLLLKSVRLRFNKFINAIFIVVDNLNCVINYLSFIIVVITSSYFSILFLISVLNFGKAPFWYWILFAIGIVVFIIATFFGIRHKYYRILESNACKENIITYLNGLLVAIIPFTVPTLIAAIVIIALFIFAIYIMLIAFLFSGRYDDRDRW